MSSKNALYQHIHGLTVGDLVGSAATPVTVKATDTVEHAVRVMSAAGVSSVPVLNVGGGDAIGYVDNLDICAFIAAAAPKASVVTAENLSRLEMFGRTIHLEMVQDVVNFSGRDALIPVDAAAAGTMPLELFARGVHRVPVVGHDGAIVNTLSQSDVNKALVKEGLVDRGHMGEFSRKPLSAFGLGRCELVTCKESDSVLDALRALTEAGVSALAILNAAGGLSGNISATTFRKLTQERMPNLLRPVSEFLEEHSPESAAAIVVREDATFADAMKTMAENKIHRVWVVDADMKPVGVVSLTDVMRTIAHAEQA